MISSKQFAIACTACWLAVFPLQASTPLTFGTTYAGAIAVPGQTNVFTFAAVSGQRVYFDSKDFDGLNLFATLVSPGGVNLYQGNDDTDAGPWTLAEPGNYQLVIGANGTVYTTNYLFRLMNLAAVPALTLGSVLSDQLTPGLSCNIYQFNGKTGQRVSLQTLAYSTNQAQWKLISPVNTVLVNGTIDKNLGTVTLPISGEYCLLISGNGATDTPLTFQVLVSDVSDAPVAASGLGTTHSGTISANQTNSFTFTAPAGLPVYFDSLDASGQSLVVDVFDPFNVSVFSGVETADAGPYVLPRSGTYTCNVRGAAGASGNYNFRLLDLTASPALALNTLVSNNLSSPYQTDVYQLNGSAGQRLYFDSLVSSFINVQARLLAPDGQNPVSTGIYNDQGPVTLQFSGTNYLFIQSGISAGTTYQFELIDIASQPALPLNQDLTGTLSPNGSLMYQLSGTAGQQIYFDGRSVSGGGAYWTLYDPHNASINGAGLGNDFEVNLPYSGVYSMVINAANNAVTFTNRVNTFSFTTNAFALGTFVTNNLVNPGDQLFYTFTGTAGQQVFYDALGPFYSSINVSLFDPTGTRLAGANASTDFGPLTLPETGTYTLMFDGDSSTVGPISFQVLDIASQPALPINIDLTGNLAANASRIYQLSVSTKQMLYFNGKGVSASGGFWALYDPNNTYLGAVAFPGDFPQVLTNAGTYSVVLSAGVNALSYSNQVNTFTFTTNTLTLGTPVTNNLVEPGDQLFYTFIGTAGQRIFFDSLFATYSQITWTLFSPSGTPITTGNASYDPSDPGPTTLPVSGIYTIQIIGSGDTVGPINFNLVDVGVQPSLALNTDLVGSLAPNATLIYQLSGTAGQQLYFNSKGGSGSGASWVLFGPNNSRVNGAYLVQDFEQTLAYTGNYVLIFSAGNNSLSYSNQVNTFSYTTNALSLSTPVDTTLAHPGDQLYYTFTGSAGQRVYFDSRQTNFANVSASLISPLGGVVFSGNSDYDAGPFTLTQNGTYTLVLDGSGDAVSEVAFNLLDLGAAQPVTLGSTISDSLTDQTQTRLYRFNGTAGQRVNLQSISASGSQALWVLYGLTDQAVGNEPYVTANIGTVTLPNTGPYTIAVIGYGALNSPVSYQLSVTDVSDSPAVASGFGTVHSGNIAAGQTNTFTFTAPAGLPVYFDSQDTSGQSLVVDLVSSDNTAVFSGTAETVDSGPYILPRSGTYSLAVRGPGNASGNYSFRLLDLSASANLPFNTPVAGTLDNPYQTEVYKFTSSAGQNFIYDALTNDLSPISIYVQLQDPQGQAVGPNGDFANDRMPFAVRYGGTCYLFVRNNRSTSQVYSFQMLDIATQPALSINTGATNTLDGYALEVFRYSGTAGQKLYFRGQPANPSGYWSIFDPNNAAVSGAGPNLSSDMEVTLPYTGTYAVVLTSYGPPAGTESFVVNDFSYTTNSYTIGTRVTDSITRPGERRAYTFTGTMGQQLIYDALTNSPPVGIIGVQLLNPQGIAEGPINGNFATDRGPFALQQSGTYTLVFDGNGPAVGPIAFQLLDVSTQPALPVNTPVANTLDVYPLQVYRYAGTAGQRLYFRGQSGNTSGFWNLYDMNNAQVANGGSSLQSDFEVILPLSGTYALVISSYAVSSGPEQFQVNDFSYSTNTYSIGATMVDAIQRPGERRAYTFSGTLGQHLIYDALTNSINLITVTLLNPQGVVENFIGGNSANDQGPFTLKQSGTYTLVFDGNTSSTGPIAFRLLDLSAQPPLPLGVSITNTLDLYAMQVYRYAGTNGQHLYFDGFQGNTSGYWRLYDPNDSFATTGGSSVASDFQASLILTGDYALVLGNQSSASATEIFSVNQFNSGEVPLVNRAPILSLIGPQVLPAGVLVTFTAQATDPDNNSLRFSLDPGSPTGASIDPTTGVFTWNPPLTGLSSVTPITVRVTDNGTPSLSAAETVSIEVIAGPTLITALRTNNYANVYYHSAPGKHYQVQFKNELYNPAWQALTNVTATALITIQPDTTIGTNAHRFYRIQALDPLP